MAKRVLVVGVGSPRGNDRLGWMVALALKERRLSGSDVRIALTPSDLLDWLEDYEYVYLCDACQGDAAKWTVHRWDWPDARIEQQRWLGSHDLGLMGVLELATELGIAPRSIVLWGLEVPHPSQPVDRATTPQLRREASTTSWPGALLTALPVDADAMRCVERATERIVAEIQTL